MFDIWYSSKFSEHDEISKAEAFRGWSDARIKGSTAIAKGISPYCQGWNAYAVMLREFQEDLGLVKEGKTSTNEELEYAKGKREAEESSHVYYLRGLDSYCQGWNYAMKCKVETL